MRKGNRRGIDMGQLAGEKRFGKLSVPAYKRKGIKIEPAERIAEQNEWKAEQAEKTKLQSLEDAISDVKVD